MQGIVGDKINYVWISAPSGSFNPIYKIDVYGAVMYMSQKLRNIHLPRTIHIVKAREKRGRYTQAYRAKKGWDQAKWVNTNERERERGRRYGS